MSNKLMPCIDCLIYPICKNEIIDYMETYEPISAHPELTIYRAYIYTLKPKCILLFNWVSEQYVPTDGVCKRYDGNPAVYHIVDQLNEVFHIS